MWTMRTVQMTMDEDLGATVDRAAKNMKTTRSGVTRQVLRKALEELTTKELVARYAEGYAKQPVQPGEFDVWENEQVWGDE